MEGHSHVKATRALHIHEEAVGRLNEALKLVLALLVRGIGMEKVILNLCTWHPRSVHHAV